MRGSGCSSNTGSVQREWQLIWEGCRTFEMAAAGGPNHLRRKQRLGCALWSHWQTFATRPSTAHTGTKQWRCSRPAQSWQSDEKCGNARSLTKKGTPARTKVVQISSNSCQNTIVFLVAPSCNRLRCLTTTRLFRRPTPWRLTTHHVGGTSQPLFEGCRERRRGPSNGNFVFLSKPRYQSVSARATWTVTPNAALPTWKELKSTQIKAASIQDNPPEGSLRLTCQSTGKGCARHLCRASRIKEMEY